jgi:DNA-binding NtrC family response regulator
MTQLATAETAVKDRVSVVQAPKSLLVIEDDLSMIQFIDTVLDEMKPGLEWDYVTSGEKAIDLIRRKGKLKGTNPYSLVITDIFLDGEMTGFDVWLDSIQLYPRMPFVITSCLTFDRYFSILRGMNNCPVYLPKPLTVSRCQSVIEEYF